MKVPSREKNASGGFHNKFKAYTKNPKECWVLGDKTVPNETVGKVGINI